MELKMNINFYLLVVAEFNQRTPKKIIGKACYMDLLQQKLSPTICSVSKKLLGVHRGQVVTGNVLAVVEDINESDWYKL